MNYPEHWPFEAFSPRVEDVKEAYANGKIHDVGLDDEIEWAMTHPDPPAHVDFAGDEAWIFPDEGIPLPDLAEIESVEIDYDELWISSNADRLQERVQTDLSITCDSDDAEDVLLALAGRS